jgi:hypothetical protein
MLRGVYIASGAVAVKRGMFSKTLTHAGHTRHFSVSPPSAAGWEVVVEQDREVVRRSRYSDWHRVERAVGALEREVEELESQGWRPAGEGLTRNQ